MNAFIQAALAAFFGTVKEIAMDKVKEEAKEFAEKLGLKVEEWTDEMLADLAARKAAMDKETRRELRIYWGVFSVLMFALGFGVHVMVG